MKKIIWIMMGMVFLVGTVFAGVISFSDKPIIINSTQGSSSDLGLLTFDCDGEKMNTTIFENFEESYLIKVMGTICDGIKTNIYYGGNQWKEDEYNPECKGFDINVRRECVCRTENQKYDGKECVDINIEVSQ